MFAPEFETVLNVSLNVSEEERMKSEILDTGYDRPGNTWEIIFRYSEFPASFFREYPELPVVRLIGNYGIVRIPEGLLGELAAAQGVIYMEIPKRLYFGKNLQEGGRVQERSVNSLSATGVPLLMEQLGGDLNGKGVLIGMADSGIDVFHAAFQTQTGETRVRVLWDQASDRVYEKEEIDRYLEQVRQGSLNASDIPEVFRDLSGHGTAVAGIAMEYAPEAELVVVRLAQSSADEYVRTSSLMQAVDFLVRKAAETGMPMALNLSIGNNYGSHTGSSLLSTYLSEIALQDRVTICVGSGNEGGRPVHASVDLTDTIRNSRPESGTSGENAYEVLLPIAEKQVSINIQIWKEYADVFRVELTAPDGTVFPVFGEDSLLLGQKNGQSNLRQFRSRGTQIVAFNGFPTPYQPLQELFLDLIPAVNYVDSGNWRLTFYPVRLISGHVEMWLPAGGLLNRGSGFAVPSSDHTLTVPSASDRVITVSAYNSMTRSYAPFSGRGFTAFTNQVKPDLAAPGVDILAPAAGSVSGYGVFTGTSFAAPAVTGAAALLMQWGIVQGNDLWLYGSRMKSLLHRQAREIGAFQQYPNEFVGYGVL